MPSNSYSSFRSQLLPYPTILFTSHSITLMKLSHCFGSRLSSYLLSHCGVASVTLKANTLASLQPLVYNELYNLLKI